VPRPELVTERLRLRPLSAHDAETFHALAVDPEVRRYLFDDEAISLERARELLATNDALFEERGCGLWTLEPKDGGAAAGVAGLWPLHDGLELLYLLDPAAWGRGYATEAARAIVEYGFDALGLDDVVASTDAPNVASVRVMERAGLRFERRAVVDGLDTIVYRLRRSER
jgi:RimJ/RimL family protein N-acetyltransferase